MRSAAVLIWAAAVWLAPTSADSYQEAYADSRGPGDSQNAQLSDRSPSSPTATVSPGVVYGAPVGGSQQAPVSPMYGVPIRHQYGPPTMNPGQQYVSPYPVYGPPSTGPTGPPGPITAPDQSLPFNIDILGFLSSIPLPDVHSVLKLLFKITVLKAVVKVISIFFLLFFAPKFEDILNMIGMITNMAGDSSQSDNDAMPSTMNDTPEEDTETTETGTKMPSSYRSRAAKELKLDRMARQLHESINRTARELACRSESCVFNFDTQSNAQNLTATGLISRMLHTLTGIPDPKKKPVGKTVKKTVKPTTLS